MELDVAIMGGGLAGAALARQLRRRLPDLSIGLFERNDDGGWKVGESSVEIACNYFVRRLGLSTYLFQEHLPKNGLRFFFDSEARDQPIEKLGEIGGLGGMPFHPSFQLDRRRLDADLRTMNIADGVHVKSDVKVTQVRPGSGGERHAFTLDDGTEVRARWLVDASGRARLLARAQGESRRDTGHDLAAAWGRVRDFVDMDQSGTQAWRDRVRNSSRFLSTNHFMYPGYWIWFIPLSRGVMSIGVVCDRALFREEWRTVPGLLAFCREHRAPRDLLEGCTPLDAMGYGHVPYACDRFFSPDRWARVGEAGAFTDPLYSPGSDFIAIENDYTTELIAMDLAGATQTELAERCDLYDQFVQFRFDATILLYRDLYCTLGSYELFGLKWDFDMHCYYNLWYDAYAQDKHLEPASVRDQLALRGPILAQLANFSKLFRDAAAEMRARGDYFKGNLEVYSHALRAVDFATEIGLPRPRKQILRGVSAIANRTRAGIIKLLDGQHVEVAPWPLGEYMLARDLRVAGRLE
ncbi:MAG TPA: tryptophan 7-halogenase [Nannocystaceae bacterium]|nr:tryptophan 7-halogenase [Nannocystaceae bacterium]